MNIKNIFRKEKKYEMNMSQANETLQNVFAACDKEPNKIPIDKLVLRQKANTKFFTIGKYIAAFFLALVLIAPLTFEHAPAKISKTINKVTNFVIVEHYIEDSLFTMNLTGDEIDYENSYATTPDGEIYSPTFYNDGCTISFPYDNKELNIFIYNKSGSYIQVIITPIKK